MLNKLKIPVAQNRLSVTCSFRRKSFAFFGKAFLIPQTSTTSTVGVVLIRGILGYKDNF